MTELHCRTVRLELGVSLRVSVTERAELHLSRGLGELAVLVLRVRRMAIPVRRER